MFHIYNSNTSRKQNVTAYRTTSISTVLLV